MLRGGIIINLKNWGKRELGKRSVMEEFSIIRKTISKGTGGRSEGREGDGEGDKPINIKEMCNENNLQGHWLNT